MRRVRRAPSDSFYPEGGHASALSNRHWVTPASRGRVGAPAPDGIVPGSPERVGASARDGIVPASRGRAGASARDRIAPAARDRAGSAARDPIGAVVILLYVFVALYLIPVFPHGASANEETRWATAASIVEHRSFEISWAEQFFGPIVDTAKVDERLYSNKAPASAILAVPAYAAARVAVGAPDASNVRVSWTLMRWAIATLPLLVIAWLAWRRGATPAALFVLLFATPLFLYGLLLFSHVLVGAAVYGAFRLLYRAENRSLRTELLAGALAGLAVSSEFVAFVPIAIFGVGVLLEPQRPLAERIRSAAWFVVGGVPFALGLALYNNALFGSPFALSYAHEAFEQWAEVAKQGFFGISWPTPANLYLLLLSPARGLYLMAPILVAPTIMLWRSTRRAGIFAPERHARRVRLAAVVVAILVMAGHGAAHGGWAAGPRYIVFVIPLLLDPILGVCRLFGSKPLDAAGKFAGEDSTKRNAATPAGGRADTGLDSNAVSSDADPTSRRRADKGVDSNAAPSDAAPAARRRAVTGTGSDTAAAQTGWGAGITGASLGAATILSVLPALTFSFAPPEFRYPHPAYWTPLLIGEGWAVPTLGAHIGLGAGLFALLPAILAIAAAFVLAIRTLSRTMTIGSIVGIALAAGYCALPGLGEPEAAVRRASMLERFGPPTGRLDAMRERITEPSQARFLESMQWQAAEGAAWAPDGWPYDPRSLAAEGPRSIQRRAVKLQNERKLDEAEAALREGRDRYPFARCAFTDNLAVVLYQTGRKDDALQELESARPLAENSWSPECTGALFHLGMLHAESGHSAAARMAFTSYLQRSEGASDPETQGQRRTAADALNRLK